ncbi:heavy metal translocating P-type ATPase [Lentilactobacillus sp. Marseille-Q4993]|uniref:heavy metal translocating P-type ATPase n=1 Tax=Lentilactobacillus sp. Marseille-Q4993 TaxID=3039492 RepID=UPI0024BCD600|nr:heavy metal translocating P-type ATPase [Lentilactobacillus sp. Marseille-Q4993]
MMKFITKHSNQITGVTGALIVLGFMGRLIKVEPVEIAAFAVASVIAAVPIILRAWSALKYKTISIELLVSIAVIGAFAIGEFEESAVVTFLFLFGSYLENKTLKKTRNSIKSLTEMAPTTALVVSEDGSVEEEDVDFVDVDDVVLVKTGAQVPVDGEIVSGHGNLNEASITGESKLVSKGIDDEVFSGTILDNGSIKVRATKVGEDTTFGKIIDLVEEAQDTKSTAEKFIDQFAKYYTPGVLVIALIVGLITRDFRLAITVLVLGCPGALVIGAPVSNVAGIGNAAKNGVLIKGGEVMNVFSKVDTLLFDKTGTITKGETRVAASLDVEPKSEYLPLLARVESESDHPLGMAIVSYADDSDVNYHDLPLHDIDTVKGKGIKAEVDGRQVLIGSRSLLADAGIELTTDQADYLSSLHEKGNSSVLMAINGRLAAILGVADIIRPDVKETLKKLKQLGIKQTVMLTGDNEKTARAVANQVGIDEVQAQLLPEDKVEVVKKLQAEGKTVAFIGDGINDSPSLTTADIGIAMGTGTDVAIDTSDIVLMTSSYDELYHGFAVSKKTVLNTKENIVIAIGTVAFLLMGLIAGFIYMASGMFVHEASILVVIFNAMRLIKFNTKPKQVDEKLTDINSISEPIK